MGHTGQGTVPRRATSEAVALKILEVLLRYAKEHPIAVVDQETWIPIVYPKDLKRAEKILGSN